MGDRHIDRQTDRGLNTTKPKGEQIDRQTKGLNMTMGDRQKNWTKYYTTMKDRQIKRLNMTM